MSTPPNNPQPSPEALAWLANRSKAVRQWQESRDEGMEFSPEASWDPDLLPEPLRSEVWQLLQSTRGSSPPS